MIREIEGQMRSCKPRDGGRVYKRRNVRNRMVYRKSDRLIVP
jgi:hypothetical protein